MRMPCHIFPQAKLPKHEKRDFIGNLQLLEGTQNQEKSDRDFADWLTTSLPADQVDGFKLKHFIPDVDLSLENFDEFFERREQLLIERLRKELL